MMMAAMSAPPRPAAVPPEATWSATDNEWILGQRDAEGRFQGLVRYWRPDGTLCCECPHQDDKPHGLSRRLHENGEVAQTCEYQAGTIHGLRTWFATDGPTTEQMHTPGMSPLVRRCELEYESGIVVAFRYFDAQGQRVLRSGQPFEPPPPGVPERATWQDGARCWLEVGWTDDGPTGRGRAWDRHGVLYAEEQFEAGHRHGESRLRRPDGSVRAVFTYRQGRLHGPAQVFHRDGTLARRAEVSEERLCWLEDLDPAGAVTHRVDAPAGAAAEVPAPPAPDPEEVVLLKAAAGGDAAALQALGARSLSPPGLARLLAVGWGGDDNRDDEVARAHRRLVRKRASPGLAARLAALGLDRAPRILTETRLQHIVVELGRDASVDAAALLGAFVEVGGAGVGALLASGGPAALAALAGRMNKHRLDLSRHGLVALPPEIGWLASLDDLNLAHNRLRTLPPELACALRLARLDLDDNRIESLPPELGRLSELRSLHLADNALERLPEGLCDLGGLETLNLGGNALTALPDEFARLTELRTLWLHDNPLRDLPPSFARLSHLTFLHLGDVAMEEPPACLFEMESLEELWLASRALRRLPPAIARLPRLRELCLWYSSLETLPEELYTLTRLRELRISNNPALPEQAMERLRAALPDCKIY
jgi:hypothetical protein